jgi:alkanesulfonate monooxygenase SsuD/methylene tetrahydromethanopterin reductase-like flavin-dependent oxidoreductase (luciferase family)
MDEMMTVLRDCWTGRPRSFHGEHIQIRDNLILEPTPIQLGGPPLLVGGMNSAALKRAGLLGDGWLALEQIDRINFEALAEGVQAVNRFAAEAGRREPRHVLLVSPPADRADDLAELVPQVAAAGFDEFAFLPPWERGVEQAQRVIDAVQTAAHSVRD